MVDLTHDIREMVATRVASVPTFLVGRRGENAATGNLDAFAGAPER